MGCKGISPSHALLFDLERGTDDHGLVRQGGGLEMQNGTELAVLGVVPEIGSGGRCIERAAFTGILTRFEDPAVIGTVGAEERGGQQEDLVCFTSCEVPITCPC